MKHWSVGGTERTAALWASLKLTSVRVTSCTHLVQILNLHIKITLGGPKTVWKIKWWKLRNCDFSFIENEGHPHLPSVVCTLGIAKRSGQPLPVSLSNQPPSHTNKHSGCWNTKCKDSKYQAIKMILTYCKYHNMFSINLCFV